MGSVLWANYLLDGSVISDQSDKYALYKHLDKLDQICRSAGLPALSSICDSTDMSVNLDIIELPEGMDSTDELMIRDGIWIDGSDAVQWLVRLLKEIQNKNSRFGLFSNDHDAVTAELVETIEFAKTAATSNAKFNFAIIM